MTDKFSNRYSVPESEAFEPDSDNQVLSNFLNIKSKIVMEDVEEQELQRTSFEVLKIFDDKHMFTVEDICEMHELWLGDVYPFAGKYRTVNMSKADFVFAPAGRINSLMHNFDKEILAKYTPCNYEADDELAHVLGLVHVELILIHPFRDGNGRIARLLADLMAMQSKRPPLNYDPIDRTKNLEGF